MKARISLFFALGFFTVSSCSSNESSKSVKNEQKTTDTVIQSESVSGVNSVKKYGIKSGIIIFETSIAGNKGKEILYFDDYGTRELLEKYSGDILKEATLCDGTSMYKIKYDQKAAYRMGNASRGVAYKFDWNEIPEADRGTNAKKLSNKTIAGKECEAFSYETGHITTIYAGWNNICLFTEQKMKVGSSSSIALNIEENAIIGAEKFQVPVGFEVK